ncbi:Ig-like domain-containing protein [bacterium]|nr:Ig-like domain-containing protein [bacterium]
MQGKRAIEILVVAAILVSFFAVGCAKRVAPSGGPADETPPKIAESVPQDGAVNFPADGEIFVRFSEPVRANRDAVMIFPPESVEINFGKDFVKVRPCEKFR